MTVASQAHPIYMAKKTAEMSETSLVCKVTAVALVCVITVMSK